MDVEGINYGWNNQQGRAEMNTGAEIFEEREVLSTIAGFME